MLDKKKPRLLQVLKWPHQILESKAIAVSVFDKDLKEIAENMHETMKNSNGIGLAANQVGILKRILTIHIPYSESDKENQVEKKWWHDQPMTFVNPEILKHSQDKTKFFEGCLSFPSIFDYVERSERITVKVFNLAGEAKIFDADDLFSCCLQHEIDHLDGVVFFKRMNRHKAKRIKLKMQKEKVTFSS